MAKKMKLRPLNDKVIIKTSKKDDVTDAGIVLPDTADKEKPEQGQVIACGPGKLLKDGSRQKLDVKVGDTVIFTKYGPNEVKIEGEEYLVASESDILAVVVS